MGITATWLESPITGTSGSQIFAYDVRNRLTSAQNAGTDCTQTVGSQRLQNDHFGDQWRSQSWGCGTVASTRFSTDAAYAGVLDGVRKDLGRSTDFSKQSDREAIGNALIKHIRQTGGCDVNGKKQPGC